MIQYGVGAEKERFTKVGKRQVLALRYLDLLGKKNVNKICYHECHTMYTSEPTFKLIHICKCKKCISHSKKKNTQANVPEHSYTQLPPRTYIKQKFQNLHCSMIGKVSSLQN